MDDMIETIRVAATDGATPEQKAAAVVACRTILAALEAEVGKPIAVSGAPSPGPLAGIPPEHALDLLIAKLSAVAESNEKSRASTAPTSPLRIALVPTPPRASSRVPRKK
jgi:hypothetical protein